MPAALLFFSVIVLTIKLTDAGKLSLSISVEDK